MSALLSTQDEGVGVTFQDVHTLLVGRVRVRVVWGSEHPAIDVADPCATVILVGALGAMLARDILKQRGREQMNRWVIESGDQ